MTHNKLAIPVLMIAASLLMLFSSNAQSQTYKANFATKLVLPSAGNDPTNVYTITSGSLAGPLSWTLPTTAGGSGYVLSTNGSGVLSWVNPATSITLAGDVTGQAGSNVIANTAGLDIVGAINTSGGAGGINGSQVNPAFGAQNVSTSGTIGGGAITGTSLTASGGGTITTTGTVSGGTGTFTNLSGTTMTGALAMGSNNITSSGTISTTGAVDGGTGVFTSTLSAVGLTSTGGLSTSGGAANLSTTDASAVNIGTGAFANTIDIGNALSTTNIAGALNLSGAVDFTGTVTLPAGSVTASSLGLASGDILVGDVSGHAADVSMSGDAGIDNTGHVTVTKFGGTTFGTMAGQSANNVNISGGTISNAALANNGALSVTGTSGLSGGGSVALGASTSLSLDVTHPNTWTGTQTLGGVALTSTAPTTLAANTLDWALSATKSYFNISAAPSAVNVSGIAGGVDGRVIVLVNTGSNAITLVGDDVTDATAGNRFHFVGGAGNNVIISSDGTVTLMYDGTNNRWRMLASE